MRLLLDTHVFLWLVESPENLSRRTLEACREPSSQLYLSAASLWEIQIKAQLGKLRLEVPLAEIVRNQEAVNGLRVVPVRREHVLELDNLPQHHRDPFDRLLVAQSRVEGLTLVSADAAIARYSAEVFW